MEQDFGIHEDQNVTEDAQASDCCELLVCPFCGELPDYNPRAESLAHPGNFWPDQIVHNCKILGQQLLTRGHSKVAAFAKWNSRAH